MTTMGASGDGTAVARHAQPAAPILELSDAGLAYGERFLWQHLDVQIRPGEFIAVLGANGSGKTSLLRAILGEQPLTTGTIRVAGRPVRRGGRQVAYVPQRISIDPVTPIRARDLVRLGLDGHRWGAGLWNVAAARRRVDALLESVGAKEFADAPVSLLSGGELQRVRIAEALAGDPSLLLCDEPLAALDLAQAQTVVSLLDARRRTRGTAILFVTHDINAVLEVADRVLYLAGGRFRLGTPDQVLTSAGLTELYGAPVDVFHTRGRVIVVAASDPGAGVHAHHEAHYGDHDATHAPARTHDPAGTRGPE